MSWRDNLLSLRLWATQLLSKKCRSGSEPLATLCPICEVLDLNLRPLAPETNALPLDQLTGQLNLWYRFILFFFEKSIELDLWFYMLY